MNNFKNNYDNCYNANQSENVIYDCKWLDTFIDISLKGQ